MKAVALLMAIALLAFVSAWARGLSSDWKLGYNSNHRSHCQSTLCYDSLHDRQIITTGGQQRGLSSPTFPQASKSNQPRVPQSSVTSSATPGDSKPDRNYLQLVAAITIIVLMLYLKSTAKSPTN